MDVRRNKFHHLLKPVHFIKYGQSQFVQNLIKSATELQSNIRKKVIQRFAKQLRDYLITSITIVNDLCPSNVMELRTNDINNCQDIED